MRALPLLIGGGLVLGACGMLDREPAPLPPAEPAVSAQRVDAFAILLERTGCRFDPASHEAFHSAGFSDEEIADIGPILVGDGRAAMATTGELVLVSGNCS